MNPVDNMMLAQHRQQGCLNIAALRMGQTHTVRDKVRVIHNSRRSIISIATATPPVPILCARM